MSMSIPRKTVILAGVVMGLTPALSHAQLGLGAERNPQDEYRRRTAQFMANRSLGQIYRSRMKSSNILFGQAPTSFMRGLHKRPLIFTEDYGLFRHDLRPSDYAGRWLDNYRAVRIDSSLVLSSINMPHATDYDTTDIAGWTTDEVLSAMRKDRPTAALALAERAPSLGPADRMHDRLEQKSIDSFHDCAATFRAAMETDDGEKRNQLINEARKHAEIVIQLEFDRPRGFLAEALIDYQSADFNAALVNLELGIRKADTIESLDINAKDFFGTSRAWEEMLDNIAKAANASESPRIHLMQSYLAFLNGDLITAQSAAERTIEGLKAELSAATKDDEIAEENAGYRRETSIEYAEHFRDLIVEKTKAPKKAGNPS
ncbi:MAG TPA: hypothetical protein P5081_08945 [Phycisphaerae bacterium]|nr:hypothetical protein [Phycisphaerae bacterium]HRW53002.1 hypothetical protein [Phycisphaerae bacterium]